MFLGMSFSSLRYVVVNSSPSTTYNACCLEECTYRGGTTNSTAMVLSYIVRRLNRQQVSVAAVKQVQLRDRLNLPALIDICIDRTEVAAVQLAAVAAAAICVNTWLLLMSSVICCCLLPRETCLQAYRQLARLLKSAAPHQD